MLSLVANPSADSSRLHGESSRTSVNGIESIQPVMSHDGALWSPEERKKTRPAACYVAA